MATIDEALARRLEEHGVTWPPTADDLPYDDGEPMESHRHDLQALGSRRQLLAHPFDVLPSDERLDDLGSGSSFVNGAKHLLSQIV